MCFNKPFFLLMCSLVGIQVHAQVIIYDPQNYALTLEQLRMDVQMNNRQVEQLTWTQYTYEEMAKIRHWQDSIAQRQLEASHWREIGWGDIDFLREQVQQMDVDPTHYFGAPHPYMAELYQLIQAENDAATAKGLFDFLFPYEDTFDPPFDLKELEKRQMEKLNKRLAGEKFLQMQKLQQAKSYYTMAQNEAKVAEELWLVLTEDGLLSMTDGERVLTLDKARQAFIQSMELRRHANALLYEVLQAPRHDEQAHEQSKNFRLQETSKRFEQLIFGHH